MMMISYGLLFMLGNADRLREKKFIDSFSEQPGSSAGGFVVLIPFFVYIVLGVFLILFALANNSWFQAWSEIEFPLLHVLFSENFDRWFVVACGVGLIGYGLYVWLSH
jgi:hypothetical protein